jgi:thiopurine S-methyltransferase
MEANFWHQKWQRGEIGFHREHANPNLVAHIDQLALAPGNRVFLPLCGKTRDIAYLLSLGYQVVGAELSELAIQALFQELSIEPNKTQLEQLTHYHAENIDIFVGDIFKLSPELLGKVDAIYDRAALVALPLLMRIDYCAHLMHLTQNAPQLVVTLEYQQELVAGPPFSISEQEVHQHYASTYSITLIERQNAEGGIKAKVPADEVVYVLK